MANSYQPEFFSFKSAVPVWIPGREKEMNLWLSFRTVLDCTHPVLRITGSCAYNIYVDGNFVAFGPARCAHGFYRVDEIDLSGYIHEKSVLAVDVAGYNVNSFYLLDQPSFLCAEVECSGKTLCATGSYGFVCREMKEHVQKVLRFSYQRTFCEAYRLSPKLADWYTDAESDLSGFDTLKLVPTESKSFIRRGCALNTYDVVPVRTIRSYDRFEVNDHSDELRYPRQVQLVDSQEFLFKGYSRHEVEVDNLLRVRNIDLTGSDIAGEPMHDVTLSEKEAVTYECTSETTGKITLEADASEDSEIIVIFDEILTEDGVLNYRKGGNIQTIVWKLDKGSYTLRSFEPYSCKFIRVYVTKGRVTLAKPRILFFGADKVDKEYTGGDPVIGKIYRAAVSTYRQNTFTIFMDCPSRERAGWLCDSFFTARSEKTLTGKSEIEHNFLENFFLPEKFQCLPDGMFPECYPADHYSGGYISNWAMFLVLELEEYLARTGDTDFIAKAKEKVYRLLKFLEGYENKDGLLEKLTHWVFVEWSRCNELTQDISFPTNMLYYRMLLSVAALYGDKECAAKAERIKKAINSQSMTPNGFYCDNAVYDESGVAKLSGEVTETCQYYAFFCGVAAPEDHPELWNRMVRDFGPERVKPGEWPKLKDDAKWPEVYASNAFIGNYLRLELLFRYGYKEKLLENIKGYFEKMADATGTLWENDLPSASTNHGFASHVVYWLDGLGYLQ